MRLKKGPFETLVCETVRSKKKKKKFSIPMIIIIFKIHEKKVWDFNP